MIVRLVGSAAISVFDLAASFPGVGGLGTETARTSGSNGSLGRGSGVRTTMSSGSVILSDGRSGTAGCSTLIAATARFGERTIGFD